MHQDTGSRDMLRTIRNLIDRAEHPGTPREEADQCRQRADALMFKYRIDAALLNSSRPTSERLKPGNIMVQMGRRDNDLIYEFARLATVVADHTGCQVVWVHRGDIDFARVYGYESERSYFDMLYTTLLLHMSGVFFPKPDDSVSLGCNLIRLRELGMNWLDMAEVYGWQKTEERQGDKIIYKRLKNGVWEKKSHYQVGSWYKRRFHEAAKSAGIEVKIIPSMDSRKAKSQSFRRSAASGYISRIDERLRAVRGARGVGSEMVLASQQDEIRAMVEHDYPSLGTAKTEEYQFNSKAYCSGINHANAADIGGAGVGSRKAQEVGS